MRNHRLIPQVNAGSMADIAFLLLIFFLVTATISSDAGINRSLPPDCPALDCNSVIKKHNILNILINNEDQIMIKDDIIAIDDLKAIVKGFIDNNGDGSCNYCHGMKATDASDNPMKAVVSLQNGKLTSYKQFITVQDELSKAYYELRSTYSLNVLKKPSDKLTKEALKQVKNAYPFILSEAEIK